VVNPELTLRTALAVSIVIVIAILLLTEIPDRNRPEQIARQEEHPDQTEQQRVAQPPVEQRLGPGQQDHGGRQTTSVRQKGSQSPQSGARKRKAENSTTNTNIATVSPASYLQKIYVDIGFDPELRQALIDSLQGGGVVLAESEEQATAVLRAEQTRGEVMIVVLVSKSQERLWWMSEKRSSGGSLQVEDRAQKIVNDLIKVDEVLSPLATARGTDVICVHVNRNGC
jgi:hypothetical protein